MSLSDSDVRKYSPSVKRRAVNTLTNKHWSDSQKLEAVTTYLALGNLTLTASVLKIPEMTLRTWKASQWWREMEGELRVQENLTLSVRLRNIIESTLSATEDRIKHGDWIYDNKSGELRRKPVNLRDVHRVTMDMIDKRTDLINQQPQSASIEQVEDKLAKIAEKLAQIAAGAKPTIEVTDVIEITTEDFNPKSEAGDSTDDHPGDGDEVEDGPPSMDGNPEITNEEEGV